MYNIYNFIESLHFLSLQIDSLQLMIDPETNRSRGYGFVQYRDPESARRAKEQLNGFELAGKHIKVGEVTEKLDNSLSSMTSVLDDEDTDRGGIEMNANARVQLMQKLASGKLHGICIFNFPPLKRDDYIFNGVTFFNHAFYQTMLKSGFCARDNNSISYFNHSF